MAEKRMLARSIIDSDAFSTMPVESQMLYVRLNLAADDDGFVSNPRMVMRMGGFSDDAMKLLISKKFVLTFEYGDDFLFLIKHWRIHNTIQKDRYKASAFRNLLRDVWYDENKSYSQNPGEGKRPVLPSPSQEDCIQAGSKADTECIQTVSEPETQNRLDKIRTDKSNTVQGRVGDRGPGEEGETQDAPTALTGTSPEGGGGTDDGLTDDRQNLIAVYKNQIGAFRRLGYDPSPIIRKAAMDGITPAELGEATG